MLHTPSEAIGSVVPIYGAGDGSGGSSGPTTDIYEAAIVVGNALAGDTTSVCNYLDPGDGTGIAAALTAAAALAPLRVRVFLRRGTYTLNRTLIGGLLTVPAGCVLEGDDEYTTILVTYAGSAGVNMTTLVLAAGTTSAKTSMRRFGISVPANGAGVPAAGARGIIHYNAYTKVEDLNVTVAAGTATNTFSFLFQADYLTAYPHGVEIRRIRHNASAANANSLTAIYTVRSNCVGVAPTAGAELPVFEDIEYVGTTALDWLVGQVLSLRIPSFDARRIRAAYAQIGVSSLAFLTYSGTVRGPFIEDVVNDIRGYVGAAGVQAWVALVSHYAASTLTIEETVIENAVLLYDTVNFDPLSLSVLAAGDGVTYVDSTLRRVHASGPVDGAPTWAVESESATGRIDGVAIIDCGGRATSLRLRGQAAGGGVTNARVIGGVFYNMVLDGAGDTTNTVINANSIRNNLTISTATVVNTIVTSNRIGGAYSDAGTGTTIGTNIVGP